MSDSHPPARATLTERMAMADRLVGEPAQTPPTPPARTGQTVSVACKFPGGLIIRAFRYEEISEPTATGWHQRKIAIEVARHTLRGPNASLARGEPNPTGIHPSLIVSGGYSVTAGVPADLWHAFLNDNKDSDLIRNRIVFALDSDDRARDAGKEHAEVRSGMEPVDPASADAIRRRVGRERLRISTMSRDGE